MSLSRLVESFPALYSLEQLLLCSDVRAHIELEARSLGRLRQGRADFLNSYDRLFRHFSLLALMHGYQVPDIQPHQTFRKMCQQFVAADDVMMVIKTRHRLKHGCSSLKPESKAVHTLSQLLQVFDEGDAQACKSLLD